MMFTETRTIANGATIQADYLRVGDCRRGSYQLSSPFTGTQITQKISNDGSTFTDAPATADEANPQTVAANGTYPLLQSVFNALFLKLVATTAQGQLVTITFALIRD